MADFDPADVETVAKAFYAHVRGSLDDWVADGGLIQDSYRGDARAVLTVLADRLLPRDADIQERRYHADGEPCVHGSPIADCPKPVTRTAYTALWSVDRG